MNTGTLVFLRAAFGYPPSWIVLALLTLLTLAFQLWFSPSLPIQLTLLALALLLGGIWLLLLAGDSHFQRRYHQLASAIDQRTLVRLYRLEAALREHGAHGNADQLRALRDEFDALSRLIIRRLHHGQMGFARHLADAERTFLAAIDRGERTLAAGAVAGADDTRLSLANERTLRVFGQLSLALREAGLATPYEALQHAFAPLDALRAGAPPPEPGAANRRRAV